MSEKSWQALERKPDEIEPWSSLLPLDRPYVVPGGRFREIYYWDSYFVMLGLLRDGRIDLARDTLDNFASLIDRYGHIPNGNRSYYLSRSQPPFFSLMVELIAARDGDAVLVKYLPELEAEYAYWMDGWAALAPGAAFRHVVRLPDGVLLNRYWDDRAAPRDESYREDVETAASANRPAEEVYRDLRAGAETGWDFSSRWLADGKTLATIRTTAIAPVDLNALMVHLEETLAKAYRLKGDAAAAARLQAAADGRAAAIRRLMWNAKGGFFADYSVARGASQRRLERGDGRPARLRPRQSGRGPRGRRDAPSAASRAGRPRNDARRHRPAMGPAERLAAAAISGDQGAERLWRDGSSRARSPAAGSRPTCAATRPRASWSRSTMSPALPARVRRAGAAANTRCRSASAGPMACSPS